MGSTTKQPLYMDGNFPHYQQEANQTIPDNRVMRNEGGKIRRDRDRCLFCCTPKVLMIISVIYLVVGIIHAISHVIMFYGCRDLYVNLDSVTPSTLSFDQSIIPTLNVKASNYYNNYDELWVSQTNDPLATNTTVQIRIATRNTNSEYETTTTPSDYNIYIAKGNAFDRFLALWTTKCVVSRVEVILPQQFATTTSSPVNINSDRFDVKFRQNSVQYPYPINLKTTSSDIYIENILSTNTSIQATSGDIIGSVLSLQEINIGSTSGDINVKVNTSTILGLSPKIGLKSTSGDIYLELNVSSASIRPIVDVSATSGDIKSDINLANGTTDSQITIQATSGDIGLNLHNTFEGQYQITTTSGDVKVGIGNNNNNSRQGRIGSINSQGFLKIGATSGDVNVVFS